MQALQFLQEADDLYNWLLSHYTYCIYGHVVNTKEIWKQI